MRHQSSEELNTAAAAMVESAAVPLSLGCAGCLWARARCVMCVSALRLFQHTHRRLARKEIAGGLPPCCLEEPSSCPWRVPAWAVPVAAGAAVRQLSSVEALLAPLPAAARVRAPNDGGHVVATITPWQLT